MRPRDFVNIVSLVIVRNKDFKPHQKHAVTGILSPAQYSVSSFPLPIQPNEHRHCVTRLQLKGSFVPLNFETLTGNFKVENLN